MNHCPHCQSIKIVKNGKTYYGKQNYKCRSCILLPSKIKWLIVDNAKMDEFRIRILDQYWITKDSDNKTDLCSHGLINLKINESTISDESDDDWTISTAGLMLLRTVESDHTDNNIYPVIQHCG